MGKYKTDLTTAHQDLQEPQSTSKPSAYQSNRSMNKVEGENQSEKYNGCNHKYEKRKQRIQTYHIKPNLNK